MEIETLRKLREKVPYGGIAKIAHMAGVTPQTVEVVRESKEQEKKIKEVLNNL